MKRQFKKSFLGHLQKFGLLSSLIILASLILVACGASTPATSSNNSTISQLFSLIPDTPANLEQLTFNDYATLRSVYKIPSDKSFAEAAKSPDVVENWQNMTRHITGSTLVENLTADKTLLAGYDYSQLEADAQGGIAPNVITVGKGKFDAAAIDKALTAAGANKTKTGNNTAYSLGDDKVSLTNQLQQAFLARLNNVTLLSDKNLLLASSKSALVQSSVDLAAKGGSSIKDNPAVKELLETFGNPQALFITSRFGTSGVATADVNGAYQKFLDYRKQNPKPPTLGGIAYSETKTGEGSYTVATYFPTPEGAKAALPVYEGLLKQGVSATSKRAYNNYFEVVSAATKGNVLVFKVKMKEAKSSLFEFFYRRDLPAFW